MPARLIHAQDGSSSALAADYGTVSAVCTVGDAESARFVWGALLASAATSAAWLLTGAAPPRLSAAPVDIAAATEAAVAAGRIKILRHRLGRPSPSAIRTMLAEFDYFGMTSNSLLIIDCADHWFEQPVRRARAPLIESLRQWAQRRQIAVVLFFHAHTAGGADRATALLRFAPHMAGIARISRDPDPGEYARPGADPALRLQCRLLFWFGSLSVLANETLMLERGADGTLQVAPAVDERSERQAALDSDSVVVLRSALAGSGGAPAHWVVCESLSDVLIACAGAAAATVILSFERTTPHDALMQVVFRLRQMAGSRLKIIVRELKVRLRYNEETMIGRLGANLIVPMEVSYARFLGMMEMVQSQVFKAALPRSYEEAMQDGLPEQVLGYLPPIAFARAVSDTLARSRALAIDNVLVRLTVANGLTPLDAMRHCSLKRAGDLFTADRKTVLVFLFACREMDATQTLERIFALPISELFGSEHRYIANLAAQSAIEAFGQRAGDGRLPDLSVELQRIAGLRTAPAAPLTAPFTTPPLAPVVGGVTTILRAGAVAPQHTPLRLRSDAMPILTQAPVTSPVVP
ncbi:MAG: cellulose biosynthesis protein BcsE [Herminiimonas sp.]|nr:cellulose biosynthesis protein BcsE [Herminiimonas sp.]